MAKNVKINSVVYAEVPQVSIPLAEGEGAATFYDTTGATAVSADVLNGKTAFLGTGSVTGSMPDNGAVSGSVGKVDGSYTIPAGYHNGKGSVTITSEEQAKLVADNIMGIIPTAFPGRVEASRTTICSRPSSCTCSSGQARR